MMKEYSFKRSFSEDPRLSDRLFNLLETVFPGMSSTAEYIRKLGASWEEASTPFVYFLDDVAIAHIGVLEIPMQLMGQPVTVGGIHAVGTHPEYRRQGYYRQVMEEILHYCDSRYDTLILTTPQPELYEPFGFRIVRESAFIAKCASTGSANGFRLLNLQDANDLQLLHRRLETRSPVSDIVGIRHEKAVFCFNEATRLLHYAQDLDIIICLEIQERQLKIFDIVGSRICTLAQILDRIPQPIDEVTIYFSPDRLNADVQAVPHILDVDGNSLLMVRGTFEVAGNPFMLPRSARC